MATFGSNTPPSDFSTLNLPTLTGLVMEETTDATSAKLLISPALAFNPAVLPGDTVNRLYNQTITSSGGIGSKSLVVSNIQNAIPGLNVPANGVDSLTITGTPTATGTESFTVTATDSHGASFQATFTITVNPLPSFSPTNLAQASVSVVYDQTITASGGTVPYTIINVTNFDAGTTGLTSADFSSNLATGTITIHGTPSAPGTAKFTANLTDAAGATIAQDYTITVVPLIVDAPSITPTNASEGASTSFAITGTFSDPGGAIVGPFTAVIHWGDNTTDTATVTGANNPFNYAFTGNHTYAQSGAYNVTVSVTDSNLATGTSTATVITVANVAPTVSTPVVTPTSTSEGASTSFSVSGTFTDPAGALDAPFVAVIHWGDGSTDTATVTGNANPFAYSFTGNHAYAQNGSYNVTVSVADKDGDTGVSSAVPVSVANVAPTVGTPVINPTAASEGTSTSFTVNGTFTDPAGALDQSFVAVINWGDGSSDSATVSGSSNPFGYAFNGSHTYAQNGSYNVTVSVTDKDGDTGTSTAVPITVTNVAPTVGTPVISPTATSEGTSTSFTVSGTFTDPAGVLDQSFVAVINWGDGSSDSATVSGSSNPFGYAFGGNHTYAQNGSYNVTVSVTDKDGDTGTSTAVPVSVANVAPTVSSPVVNPTAASEGTSAAFTVSGTFTDPASGLDQSYVAVVHWGDGSTDTATVSGSSNPFSYAFNGNHTYAQNGSYNVTVSVTDKDGDTGTSTAVPVSVANVAPTVSSPVANPTAANEGTSAAFTVSGTFTDPASGLDQSYVAVVNWGDGSSDTATVGGSSNPFSYAFDGNHTYAQNGSFNVTVSVTDKDGDTGTSTAVQVAVANVAPTVGTPVVNPTVASEGTSAAFTVSGTFTDPASGLDQSYVAVVNWGDGSTDTAAVSGSSNPFGYAFTGNHTYARSGSFNVTVSVTDKDGDTGTSSSVAVNVAKVAPTVGTPLVNPSAASEGTSTSFTISGTFSDPADAQGQPYVAVVNWGDGTTDLATVSGIGNPFGYAFNGSHTYTQNGNFNVTVSVTNKDGDTGVSSAVPVSVANVAPTVGTPVINPTAASEGASTSFSVSGSFTDPAGALDQSYVAVVNWGDGTSDTATVSGSSNPFGYAFTGNHTYAQSGSFNVTVSVTDKDGDTGTSLAVPVTVANVAPAVGTPIVNPTTANIGTNTSFGVSGTFTDPAGAMDQSFTAVIHWGDGSTDTATVSGTTNPFSYAFNGNHIYAQSGNFNVTVTVKDKDGDTGVSAPVVVTVATSVQFKITAPASATTGTPFNFTVTAVDPLGNTVTGYSGTVHFSSFDSVASLPGDATLTAGSGTFSATLNTSGNQTITATDTVNGSITATTDPITVTGTGGNHNTYVQQLYVELLHRPADPTGLQYFTQLLNSGAAGRSETVLLIEGSAEYHGIQTQALYQKLLARAADPTGLTFWVTFLGSGGSVLQMENIILGSAEYFGGHGEHSNEGFIEAVYSDVLGRAPDPAGDLFFNKYLATDGTRFGLANVILNSAEDQLDRLKSYYQDFLRRPLEPVGQMFWTNLLAHGLSDELVIAGILGSDEYLAKFPQFPG